MCIALRYSLPWWGYEGGPDLAKSQVIIQERGIPTRGLGGGVDGEGRMERLRIDAARCSGKGKAC